MRRILFYVGGGASVGFIVFFVLFLKNSISVDSLRALWTTSAVVSIAFSALLYALIIPISAWAWCQLLASMGEHWTVSRATIVMAVTQIAKYVPGNVAQHIGRAALSMTMRMNPGVFCVSVFFETLFAAGGAVVVGSVAWVLSGDVFGVRNEYLFPKMASVVFLLMGLGGLGTLLVRLLPNLRNKFSWLGKWVGEGVKPPSFGLALRIVPAYCLNYAIIGLGFVLVSCATAVGVVPGYFFLTAVFSVAWLVGFLAPGLPAGLGAREGVMALLLSGRMANEDVLNVLVGMRLVTVFGDLLCCAAGFVMLRRISSCRILKNESCARGAGENTSEKR